jgi:hypothetical protein
MEFNRRLVIAVVAMAGLSACLGGAHADWREEVPVFRIGILGGDLKDRQLRAFACLKERTERALEVPVELRTSRDYSGVTAGLLSGELQAAGLGAADVVSLHLPLTGATEGILDRDALEAMKKRSVLVNTARGGLVETEALTDALRHGPLAAAGLDVYRDEPEIPETLRELPGCFVLPHLGSATVHARAEMWELAAENVRRVLRGDVPLTPVEPS